MSDRKPEDAGKHDYGGHATKQGFVIGYPGADIADEVHADNLAEKTKADNVGSERSLRKSDSILATSATGFLDEVARMRTCFDRLEQMANGMSETGDTHFFGPYIAHASFENASPDHRRVFINGYAYPGANSRVYPGTGAGRGVHFHIARYEESAQTTRKINRASDLVYNGTMMPKLPGLRN